MFRHFYNKLPFYSKIDRTLINRVPQNFSQKMLFQKQNEQLLITKTAEAIKNIFHNKSPWRRAALREIPFGRYCHQRTVLRFAIWARFIQGIY